MSKDNSDVTKLKEILQLEDDDLGIALTSLITTAVRDEEPEHTLNELAETLKLTRSASALEPLTVIPIVVGSLEDSADDLMSLMASECSAKEFVMAVEEALESLDRQLRAEDDEEEEEKPTKLSSVKQLVRLVRGYTATIPRLPGWKKSPEAVLESRLPELESIISLVGPDANPEEGRLLVTAVSQFVLALGDGADEKLKDVLRHIIDHTIETFANIIGAGLARKAFAAQFPRLVVPQSEPSGGSGSREDTLTSTWSALYALGLNAGSYESYQSLASFILLAHDPMYTFSESKLAAFFPTILSSVQTNVALEEVLSVLLSSLAPLWKKTPRPELDTDLIVPLVHLLPHLASNHPDKDLRHYTFRIISLVLGLTPFNTRFRLLEELLSDDDLPPQIRVAAVGLLKEAVLEGLSRLDKNVFASPYLLATFGPIVFRPHPPDILDSVLLDDFLDSSEPLRLVECLGFFYVLLKRDVHNRTGVRDDASLGNVQRTLLQPLGRRLRTWREDLDADKHNGEEVVVCNHDMQLEILDMWLERAQNAVSELLR